MVIVGVNSIPSSLQGSRHKCVLCAQTTDEPGLRYRLLCGLQLYVISMFPIPKLDVAGSTPVARSKILS